MTENRELMVSHKSDLLTQDLILKGIFQYTRFKQFGVSFNFPRIRYENKTGNITYPVEEIEELRKLKLNVEDFERLIKLLKKEVEEYKKYIKKFELEIESSEEKEKKILEYFDKTLKAVSVVPYFAFEASLVATLENEGIAQSDIPSTETYSSRSSKELKKIADNYKDELARKKGQASEALLKEIDQFCDKFGYLGMKYFGGSPWDVETVYDLLFNFEDTDGDLEEKNAKIDSPYVKIASDLLYFRTQNWELMCYGCYLFRKLIMDSYGDDLKYEKLLNLRVDDLLEVVQGNAKLSDKLKDYDEDFVLEIKDNGVSFGSETTNFDEKIDLDLDEIKGVTAQKGSVKGKVKVVLTPKECEKVEKGDILVTTMSTPDFLPAMYKAVAFVTDIGGITSHAAIVSREMKKPCVIGTKIATKIFKDGDLVEVDADKGVVRILERKK